MAKAKKPAAKKSSSAAAKKPAASRPESKSSATTASSNASKAAADVKAATDQARATVSPSEMKKELEAKSMPAPAVAKEVPSTFAAKEPSTEVETPVEDRRTPAPAPEQTENRGSVFWPLVFGGAIAAALGFLASELDLLGTRSQTDDLRANISSQDTRLTALESVEPVKIPEMPELTFPELDELTTEVTAMSGRLDDLDVRLTAVEKQPITGGTSQTAIAAYERELEALQASVAAQRAEIEDLFDTAMSVEEANENAARLARQQGALTELTSAINAGQPFAAPLGILEETGVTDLPAALSDVAQDGVQTLNALQSAFPDSARASLAAARSSGTNDTESGVSGFLRRQLGARSVTPREGDDPDAVLSRAEAAVREGRLNDALGELGALPEPAQAAMQSWLDDARARQAAEAATKELSQSLTAN